MASFTDQPIAFREYISQLPVIGAMTEIGMEKQQLYNQGVQKIQSTIDNIAGLDVIRDVDKQYLQSKLDQMGNRLKIVAAGDFSNFQLTNSVGGMVGQIAKDPNVLNAVNSTAKFRKEQAYGETLRKEGKLSPNREYDFQRAANEWLNSKELSAPFIGQYKAHVDVNKKVIEIIGKLHPNVNIQDIPYAVNSDGTINYKVIADAMQRRGETEVSEGQIKTAVSSMLDADDIDELSSQGRYIYKDYSPYQLQAEVSRNHLISRASAQDKLDKLQRQLLVTTDVGQQSAINESINHFKSLLGDSKNGIPSTLDETYKSVIESIPSNPDGARATLYTRNWLNEVGNGFAYREVKDEVLSNPFKDNFWKQKNYELDQIKESHLQDYRAKQLNIEERKLQLEEQKNAPGTPYFKGKGNTATNNLTALQDFTNHNDGLKNENSAILQELADRSSTPTTKVLPSDVLMKIEEYKANRYSPKSTREKQKFDTYIKNSNFLDNQREIYETYEDQAYRELSGGLDKNQTLSQKLQNIGSLTISLPSGGTTTFSSREVYDFLSKEKFSHPTLVGSAFMPTSESSLRIDDSQLTDREKLLKQTISKRYSGPGGYTGMSDIDKYIGSFRPIMNETNNVKDKVLKIVAEKMAPITGEFAAQQAGIDFKNPEARDNFVGQLTNIAQADLGQKTGGENYDPERTFKYLTKEKGANVKFQFVRQGNKYFVQVTDASNPDDIQLVPVETEFVEKNQNLGTNFLNKNLDLADVMLRNNNSTNIFQDYDHAYYNSGKFGTYDLKTGKRTVTLPIACDLERDGDQIYATFKIKKGTDNFVKLNFPLPIDYTRFENEYLPSLTDEKIKELFKAFSNLNQVNSD